MGVSVIGRLAVLAMMATGPVAHGAEETCALKLAASLDLLDNPGGIPIVPVTFNGRPAKMILDTGAFWSGLTPAAAKGLPARALSYIGMGGAGGSVMRTAVKAAGLQIGQIDIPESDFFVFARDDRDPEVIGNIGANILKAYDVEIDYPGRRAKLYLQNHCPGRVVSWPHEDLAKIPFTLNKVGHISLPVTLDGHKYQALLDTGATASYLDRKAANRDFNLSGETANASGVADTLDGKRLPTFYHRFDMFDLGGLEFHRPQLAFLTGQGEDGSGWRHEDMPSLILGMHQLRRLHFYIAYGERALYASVAPSGHLPVDNIDLSEVRRLVVEARKQIAAEDYSGAVESLGEALRSAPEMSPLYAARASALLKNGDTAAAIADLVRAHELAPDDVSILSSLASAHQLSGDAAAETADLDEVIRLDPNSADALTRRCTLKMRAGQFEQALPDCEQALVLDATRQEARLDRAYLHMQRRQWDLAQADCNAVLAADPNSADALAYLDQIRQAQIATASVPAKAKRQVNK